MMHTIDAAGRTIGRVATEAAMILMGKDTPHYERNIAPEVKVHVVNASKVRITEKKRKATTFKSFSGYPGGLKIRSFDHVTGKKGYAEVVKIAVKGMLPKNKLQDKMMKHLTISE